MSDIHAQKAHEIFGTPLDKISKEQKRIGKVVNFGTLYGCDKALIAKITRSKYEDDNQSTSVL